jgi:hypothetical protein
MGVPMHRASMASWQAAATCRMAQKRPVKREGRGAGAPLSALGGSAAPAEPRGGGERQRAAAAGVGAPAPSRGGSGRRGVHGRGRGHVSRASWVSDPCTGSQLRCGGQARGGGWRLDRAAGLAREPPAGGWSRRGVRGGERGWPEGRGGQRGPVRHAAGQPDLTWREVRIGLCGGGLRLRLRRRIGLCGGGLQRRLRLGLCGFRLGLRLRLGRGLRLRGVVIDVRCHGCQHLVDGGGGCSVSGSPDEVGEGPGCRRDLVWVRDPWALHCGGIDRAGGGDRVVHGAACPALALGLVPAARARVLPTGHAEVERSIEGVDLVIGCRVLLLAPRCCERVVEARLAAEHEVPETPGENTDPAQPAATGLQGRERIACAAPLAEGLRHDLRHSDLTPGRAGPPGARRVYPAGPPNSLQSQVPPSPSDGPPRGRGRTLC